MYSTAKIQERINHYTDLVEKYKANKNHSSRLQVTNSLLAFWENQLIKHQKS